MAIPRLKKNDLIEILWHDAHDAGCVEKQWMGRNEVGGKKFDYECLSVGYLLKTDQDMIYIAGDKIKNNVVTPSKMAAGSSYLWQWSYDKVTDLDASETGEIISRVTNGTYKVWQRAYLYIPSGAKYVVLGVRASAQNYPANWRINVNGTAGSVAQPTYNAGINNAYGSPLDISSQAGAWRLCTIELSGAGGSSGVVAVAFTVTWYGA